RGSGRSPRRSSGCGPSPTDSQDKENNMKRRGFWITVVAATLALGPWPPAAQANEIFIPLLVYRTGAYAPSGIPSANGFNDYFNLLNERDGGINGGKVAFEIGRA